MKNSTLIPAVAAGLLLAGTAAANANPILGEGQAVAVLSDAELGDVKGSGATSKYYSYLGAYYGAYAALYGASAQYYDRYSDAYNAYTYAGYSYNYYYYAQYYARLGQ